MIDWTHIAGQYAAQGTPQAMPWAVLVAFVRALVVQAVAAKTDLPAILPGSLGPSCTCGASNCPGGHHRCNANVQAITIGAVDCDEIPYERWPDFLARVATLGAAIVYTTASDGIKEGGRRARVLVKLSRSVPASDSKRLRLAIEKQIGEKIDDHALHASALFFMGRADARHAAREFHEFEGDAVDVDALIATVPEAPPVEERSMLVFDDEEQPLAGDLCAAIAADLLPHYELGHRHSIAYGIGGLLRNRGASEEAVISIVSTLPSKDPEARIKDALSAYRSAQPAGWSRLEKHLPSETLERIGGALPIDARRQPDQLDRIILEAFAEGSGAPEGEAPTNPEIEFWDLSAPIPPIDYLIPDLELAPGRVNMLVGYSNSGKTMCAQALALAVATGANCWGRFPVRKGRVLHLDAEAGVIVVENYKRLACAARIEIADVARDLVVGRSRLMLDAHGAEKRLTTLCQGFALVILDTLRASAGGLDENKAEIASALYMLGRVSAATNATILVLHHERKPDGDKRTAAVHMISGHNAIHGALQVAISLARGEDEETISVAPSKKIRRGFRPFDLRIDDVDADGQPISFEDSLDSLDGVSSGVRVVAIETPDAKKLTPAEKNALVIDECTEAITQALRSSPGVPIVSRHFATTIAKPEKMVANALTQMLNDGLLRKVKGSPVSYVSTGLSSPQKIPGAPPTSSADIAERVATVTGLPPAIG